MPDPKENKLANEETTPDTPLHAYKEGRDEDVVGDPHPEVGEEGDRDEGVGNPVGESGDEDADEAGAKKAPKSESGEEADEGEKGLGSESNAVGGGESATTNPDPSTKGATKGTQEAL